MKTYENAVSVLGLSLSNGRPDIRAVKRAYFENALKNHPDKNINVDAKSREEKEEIFKSLLEAYKLVMEVALQDENGEDEEYDSDEEVPEELCFIGEEYKNTHITKVNLQSVTLEIPSEHANAWEQVLDVRYRNRIDRS